MKVDQEILLETADRQAPPQEIGNPPMGKKRDLQDAIAQAQNRVFVVNLMTKAGESRRSSVLALNVRPQTPTVIPRNVPPAAR